MTKARKTEPETETEKLEITPETTVTYGSQVTPIVKPSGFSLDKFKTKTPDLGGVATLIEALPHYPIPRADDFVRLSPDEDNFWSPELSFVRVPIIGMKDKMLHLIDDELARNNLPSGKIKNFRLALATKPNNVFFLAEIPTRNTDNSFVMSHLRGVEQAKTRWAPLTSQKAEGRETYKVEFPRNEKAFPEPDWPNPKKQSLESLIEAAFTGRIINEEDDAAFLRLIGDVQSLG